MSSGSLTGRVGPDVGTPLVALVGNTNVGKSTLFNQLSGARQEIGNWPGTTVEVSRAAWRARGSDGADHTLELIDLPGAVSLTPVSPDEEFTRELLVEDTAARPDAIVAVVDASNLARSLYLVAQLREQPQRLVLAVTMGDVAAKRGLAVDASALARETGAPVVELDPRRRKGDTSLTDAVVQVLRQPPVEARPRRVPRDHPLAEDDERFAWVQGVLSASTETGDPTGTTGTTLSDRIDHFTTAPVVGPLLFLAVMWLVFQVTTTVAAPLQDSLDGLISGPLSTGVIALLGALGLGGGVLEGFLVDGLLVGVGTLLTFVPLMALMFLLLAFLESSGYLARAAVVTERAMRAIGLPGRAFLPLIVGFGCNVPAISATRVLPDARQRLLTALLVPFTSCSARLTVFVLVGATFFGSQAGNVVFAMYLLSVVLVIGVGFLLRSTLWRTMGHEPMVIDLPPYHLPMPRQVGLVTWARLWAFLRTAGGIIVLTVIAVWALSATPAPGSGQAFGEVPVEDSLYAATAETISPVFEPAGFGDWHATSALMAGLVAKEAVISSWAQTYSAEEPADPAAPGELGPLLVRDFEESSGGHAKAAVLAFLTFLLAYTPCVATLAAQRREIGFRWMLVSVGISMSVAWLLAVAVFQVGRLFT